MKETEPRKELDFLTKALLSRVQIPSTLKTNRDQSEDFEHFLTRFDAQMRRANELGIDLHKLGDLNDVFLDKEEKRQNGKQTNR